jgi:hypothetical protein
MVIDKERPRLYKIYYTEADGKREGIEEGERERERGREGREITHLNN